MSRGHQGAQSASHGQEPHSRLHLLQSASSIGRSNRSRGKRRRPRNSRRSFSFCRQRQGDRARRGSGTDKSGVRQEDRATARRAHDRRGSDRIDPGLRDCHEPGDDGRRIDAHGVPASDIVGDDEGGGAGCLWPRAEHLKHKKERPPSVKDNDNLTIERPNFVTHLECAMEGDHYPADQIHNLSKANKPLLVRYDLAGVKKALTKDALKERPADLWRYREMLPVRKVTDIVSLGEVTTPLIRLPKLSEKISGGEIIVKDEGRLPTGSFKPRGLVMPVALPQPPHLPPLAL